MGGDAGANGESDTEAQTAPGTEGYILLIDDEPSILDVLVDFLRDDEHYEVWAAHSGEEALRLAKEAPPGLILMDVTLPGEDMETVVQALRARPGWRSVPLAILSGAEDLSQLTARLGAQAYLKKPFNLEEVGQLAERMGVPRRW